MRLAKQLALCAFETAGIAAVVIVWVYIWTALPA
jgi:hypothetical protein